jgi:HSP20 family protein
MANEGTTGGTGDPGRKGQTQQEKATEQQGKAAGRPAKQEAGARGERERSGGLSRWFDPAALERGFMASPFSLMRRLMDDLDRLFEESGSGSAEAPAGGQELQRTSRREIFWTPRVDVFERDGALVVRADLPGLSKEDIRVDIENDALVIHGERRQEREVEGSGTYRAERFHGTFRRVIPLPQGIDPDAVHASFENGVLEVSLRLPEEKPRGKRIEIGEGKQGSVH